MSLKTIYDYDSDQLRNEVVFLQHELGDVRSVLQSWIILAFVVWNSFVNILAWGLIGDYRFVPVIITVINITIWFKVRSSMESADFERYCRHSERNEA